MQTGSPPAASPWVIPLPVDSHVVQEPRAPSNKCASRGHVFPITGPSSESPQQLLPVWSPPLTFRFLVLTAGPCPHPRRLARPRLGLAKPVPTDRVTLPASGLTYPRPLP